MSPPIARLREAGAAVWRRTQPAHAVGFFAAGFLWDALTLDRIDRLSDNILLGTYLLALGGLLALGRHVVRAPEDWPRLAPRVRWLRLGEQFLFGGLYSAYFIFYSKSASAGRALVFVGLLLALLLANEFLHGRLRARRLRIALFTLCAFSFLLFFIPVTTGWLGRGVVGVAGIAAAALALGVVALSELGQGTLGVEARQQAGAVGGVLLALAVAEGLHLIPPVPLAVLEGGIFHEVERIGGEYVVTYERAPWWRPLVSDDRDFRRADGESAWCFTSVFAPDDTALDIVHRWERNTDDGWAVTDEIPFSVIGGRGRGFRGYTRKRNLGEGTDWRVTVLGPGGRELARYDLTVAPYRGEPDDRVWRTRVIE